jgi:outer membrane protein OmpA-like peptidoglycan-associated protein
MRAVQGWRSVVSFVVVAIMAATTPSDSRAESGWLNLHLEAGPTFFLTEPQASRFGIGGGGAFRADFSPWSFLGFQIGVVYAQYPVGDYDFEAEGFARPERGYTLMATGGIRFRILNDQNGYALPWRRGRQYRHEGNLHGNLWIDANVSYVRTGEVNRLGLEAGIGYEMSLVDGLQLGPFVRYIHVFQPDDQLDTADALALLVGLSFSVAVPSHARFEVIGDADGDGILDDVDQCPNDPEDFDGFEDEDGCPDPDNDGDGIPDVEDSCPNNPEDFDGFEDEDGCPDPDNDGDGILDVDDLCPNEPETINGIDDDDGCPDEADIEVVDNDILLRERVFFDFAMARVRGRSWPLLEQIANLLRAHPEYLIVSIEGHCDDVGAELINQQLSERRAERVRRHLIRRHGISEDRLRSVGFGRSRPLLRQISEAARQQNRRVEFRSRVAMNPEPSRICRPGSATRIEMVALKSSVKSSRESWERRMGSRGAQPTRATPAIASRAMRLTALVAALTINMVADRRQ